MTLRDLLCYLCAALCFAYTVVAQDVPGNVVSTTLPIKESIKSVSGSEFETYAVLFAGDNLYCIETETARVLWSKPCNGALDVVRRCILWQGDDTVVVPTTTALCFVRASDGFVLDSIPYNDCVLKKFVYEEFKEAVKDDVHPVRFGNVMVIPQRRTFDVVDLKSRKLIYRSTQMYYAHRWVVYGDHALLVSDIDTSIVIDTRKAKIVSQIDVRQDRIDIEFGQPLYAFRDYGLVVHKRGLFVLNFRDVTVRNVEYDTKQLVNIGSLIPNNVLHVVLQSPEELALLNCSTGGFVWRNNVTDDDFGTIMLPYHQTDSTFLLTLQDDDKFQCLTSLRYRDGGEVFRKRIAMSYRSWSPTLTEKTLFANGSLKYRRPYSLDSMGFQTFWSMVYSDSVATITDENFVELMNRRILAFYSKVYAIIIPIRVTQDEIHVMSVGVTKRAWGDEVSDSAYSGEAFLRLRAHTGRILEARPVPVYRGRQEATYDYNALDVALVPMSESSVIVGANNIVRIRPDGNVDTAGFMTNFVKVIDVGIDYVAVSYIDKNDRFYIYRVELTPTELTRKLMLFSTSRTQMGYGDDTTHADYSLVTESTSISVFTSLNAVPKQWPEPIHRITKEMLAAANVGDLTDESSVIFPLRDRLIIAGTKGLAVYSFANRALVRIGSPNELPAEDVATYARLLGSGGLILGGDERMLLLELLEGGAVRVAMSLESNSDTQLSWDAKKQLVRFIDRDARRMNVGRISHGMK